LASRACQAGRLADEIVPVQVSAPRGTSEILQDEIIRPDTNLEKLSSLKPVFKKDGIVTAGNASALSDGAAALILTRRDIAAKNRWTILAEWQDHHVVGCDPARMGLGPVGAVRGLLKKTATSLDKYKMIEINEAFAAQYLSVEKQLGLPREITNRDGGAIALGHPLGASGARILVHLIYGLSRTGGGLGLGSACIGGGQGIAVSLRI
jgi:acetyl-CoA acetyltransferase family protein